MGCKGGLSGQLPSSWLGHMSQWCGHFQKRGILRRPGWWPGAPGLGTPRKWLSGLSLEFQRQCCCRERGSSFIFSRDTRPKVPLQLQEPRGSNEPIIWRPLEGCLLSGPGGTECPPKPSDQRTFPLSHWRLLIEIPAHLHSLEDRREGSQGLA